VGCGAGFHADQAWRQRSKNAFHLAAAKLPPLSGIYCVWKHLVPQAMVEFYQ
jgi:hypothetical protein